MRYETIRQTGKRPEFPNEGTIRRMVKCGEVPGFYANSRFYVDTVKFAEKLDTLSTLTAKEATAQ